MALCTADSSVLVVFAKPLSLKDFIRNDVIVRCVRDSSDLETLK